MIVQDLRRHLRESAVWYGGLGLLTVRVARNLTLPPSYFWLVAREIDIIGVRSLTVALTVELFTGMVLVLQTAVNMARFGAENYVGALVTLIGCYNGLATEGGTEGLGRSTTATVVQLAMGVIISDFFITKLFLLMFW